MRPLRWVGRGLLRVLSWLNCPGGSVWLSAFAWLSMLAMTVAVTFDDSKDIEWLHFALIFWWACVLFQSLWKYKKHLQEIVDDAIKRLGEPTEDVEWSVASRRRARAKIQATQKRMQKAARAMQKAARASGVRSSKLKSSLINFRFRVKVKTIKWPKPPKISK